jgi:hydrogenase maturation protease
MNVPAGRILLLCYGNPGRLDDGLGPAFGEAIAAIAAPDVDIEVNYQLTVEDVKAAADHEVVIFVDAAVTGVEPFFLKPVSPKSTVSFSSHTLEPEHVLALAGQLFGHTPAGFALGIRGYQFNEFGEQLSPAAQANLEATLQFILPLLKQGNFAEASAALASIRASGPANKGE